MHGKTGGFIDHQNILILVQDGKGECSRRDPFGRGVFQNTDLKHIPGQESLIQAAGFSVDLRAAISAFQLCKILPGIRPAPEKLLNADIGIFCLNLVSDRTLHVCICYLFLYYLVLPY